MNLHVRVVTDCSDGDDTKKGEKRDIYIVKVNGWKEIKERKKIEYVRERLSLHSILLISLGLSSAIMSNQQHPHPGIAPTITNSITLIMPDTGDVVHLMYEYYAAPANQPETTVYLPTGIIQTGGTPMFPPDYPGGIQKLNWSED